jgi:hypothetical protein
MNKTVAVVVSHPFARKEADGRGTGASGGGPAEVPAGRNLSRGVKTLPKLDVFPSPQPLSPEEKALVSFAARAPEPVRQALIDAQTQADAPLNIAAIEIQPLDPPDQGGN